MKGISLGWIAWISMASARLQSYYSDDGNPIFMSPYDPIGFPILTVLNNEYVYIQCELDCSCSITARVEVTGRRGSIAVTTLGCDSDATRGGIARTETHQYCHVQINSGALEALQNLMKVTTESSVPVDGICKVLPEPTPPPLQLPILSYPTLRGANRVYAIPISPFHQDLEDVGFFFKARCYRGCFCFIQYPSFSAVDYTTRTGSYDIACAEVSATIDHDHEKKCHLEIDTAQVQRRYIQDRSIESVGPHCKPIAP